MSPSQPNLSNANQNTNTNTNANANVNANATDTNNTSRAHHGFTRNINNSQMYLLEMYNAQYNDLMRQINERHQEASTIREIMNAIVSTSFPNMPAPNVLRPTPAGLGNIRANPLSYVDSLFTNPANNYNHNNNQNNQNNNNRRQQSRRTVGSQRRPRNTPAFTPFANSLFSSFFERIPVAPTSEQIRQSTRTLAFRDVENPINERCPISFEAFRPNEEVLQIIRCGHIFNPCEIAVWFESNVGCPVCRFDIRDHSVPPVSNTRAPSYPYQNEENESQSPSPEIMRQNASDDSVMEETKDDTSSQETKEEERSTPNTNRSTNESNTRPISSTPLIDAIMYILSPVSNERINSELSSMIQELNDETSSPTISFDSSYNMYYMDYDFNIGPRK